MIVKVLPSNIAGIVSAPKSKSYTHRLSICNAFAGEKVDVKDFPKALDNARTRDGIRALLACERTPIIVNCGESGSTLRFLLPIACALGVNAIFNVEGRLTERPLGALVDVLNAHGASVSNVAPYEVKGKIHSGVYEIDGGISSQYITGLIFALSILDGDSEIIIKNVLESKPYVDITIDTLKRFGVIVKETTNGYYVKGAQKYISPEVVEIEGDYSGAANMLVAGALKGQVEVSGLYHDSKQGDKAIVEVLKLAGANVQATNSSVMVTQSALNPIEYDCKNIPDIVPIIASLCANINGKSVLKNVERLRLKESDRLAAIIDILTSVGVHAEYNGDLVIYGGEVVGGSVSGYNDHRMVMCASVLGITSKNGVTISDAESISKSYPEFFEDFERLGAVVCRL